MIKIRPANMRTVHGIRHPEPSPRNRPYSVSTVQCMENRTLDHLQIRETGAGMDAPEDLPVGSVKAFFDCTIHGLCPVIVNIGHCQRTVSRETGKLT